MSSTRQTPNDSARVQSNLRRLVDDIAYARALIRLEPDELGEHERPLRLALRDALEQLADSEEERRQIASDAMAVAWAKVAERLGFEPEGEDGSPWASAA